MKIGELNRQRFESMGIDQVALFIANGLFPPETTVEAVAWVAQRESEERSRRDAASAEQVAASLRQAATADRQSLLAEKANKRATVAIIIGVIAIIVSIVMPWIMHRNATSSSSVVPTITPAPARSPR